MADRKLIVEVIGDDSSLHRALGRSSKDTKEWGKSVERVARGGLVATVGFRGLGRSVAFASGAFLGGAGLTAAVKSSVDAASDLSEQINKTNVLFRRSAGDVTAWSRTTATAFGISQRAALAAAGGFGSMLETAGLTADEASKFSRRLVELGADMASFNNIDPSEALDKLRSGLAGEAEPLRQVGVLLSESRVQQEAYAEGIAAAGSKLTEQQKVLARYSLILKDTARQQGDFARTSGGLANQQRILAAQIENLQASLGRALLPDILRVVRGLNQWLASSENQERVQREVNNTIKSARSIVQGLLDVLRPLAGVAESVANAVGGTRNAIRLLVVAMVASKVISFTGAITGLGSEALVSTGRVNALRGALLRLGAIGVITIAVEILLNRDKVTEFGRTIERKIDDILPGGQFRQGINIPVTASVQDLEKVRNKLADIKGEGDLQVVVLDRIISKLRVISRQRFTQVSNSFETFRKRVAKLPEKKRIDVQATQRGLDKILGQLAQVKDKTVEVRTLERGLTDIVTRLGRVQSKTVDVQFVERGLDAIREELDRISGKSIEITVLEGKDARAGGAAGGDAVKAIQNMEAAINGAFDRLRKSVKRGKVAARRAFDDLMASLDRAEVRAGGTTTERDNLRVLQQKLAAVQQEIRIEGKTNELLDLEASLTADIANTQRGIAEGVREEAQAARESAVAAKEAARERQRAIRERIAANRKASQFTRLGLTKTGDQPTPGVESLGRRTATLQQQIKGTTLDTSKTRAQLRRIARVLSGDFGKVGKDVRSAILQMLNDIANALKQGSDQINKVGPLTKTSGLNTKKIIEGLGLDADTANQLRGRLSGFNTQGLALAGGQNRPTGGGFSGGFVVENHVTVAIDGQKIASTVTKHQQKRKRRNPQQKRGPNRRGDDT